MGRREEIEWLVVVGYRGGMDDVEALDVWRNHCREGVRKGGKEGYGYSGCDYKCKERLGGRAGFRKNKQHEANVRTTYLRILYECGGHRINFAAPFVAEDAYSLLACQPPSERSPDRICQGITANPTKQCS